jgi:hypothetical protein
MGTQTADRLGPLTDEAAAGDIAAAVERVRAAAGQAGVPGHRSFGLSALRTDDQGGTAFRLWQPAD